MDRIKLGRMIKEARLAKKMTQSEVVGDFITRNMLSQIESGSAYPSLKTLDYLADKLDIPLQLLVPENARDSDELLAPLLKAKDALKSGNLAAANEAVLPLLVEDGDLFDEAAAITAQCCVGLAENTEKSGDLQHAYTLALRAYELSDIGLYRSREVKNRAIILLDRIAESVDSGRRG